MPGIVSIKKTVVTIVIAGQMNVLCAWTAFYCFYFGNQILQSLFMSGLEIEVPTEVLNKDYKENSIFPTINLFF